MSQREVYIILKELGGKATRDQIAAVAERKQPGLNAYLSRQLKRLQKSGYISMQNGYWKIEEPFPGVQ